MPNRFRLLPDITLWSHFSGDNVARPRPRSVMRPHLGVRIATLRVAAALMGARLRHGWHSYAGDEAQVAYPAALATSAQSTVSAAPVGGQEVSRHAARAAITTNVAAPKPTGYASETIRLVLKPKLIGSRCATTDLSMRTEAREDSVVVGVHAERRLSITAITNQHREVGPHRRQEPGCAPHHLLAADCQSCGAPARLDSRRQRYRRVADPHARLAQQLLHSGGLT